MSQDASSSPTGVGPHAAEERLAMYALDPEQVDAMTRAHIESCAVCREEAGWLRGVANAGEATRDRARCPEADRLIAYALGEVRGAERRAIEAHVRGCLQCAADVALTRTELAPAARPAFVPLAPLRRVLANLLAAPAQPALALRDAGGDEVEPHVYVAGELETTLRPVPDAAHRGHYVLVGALSGDETSPALPALLARLLRPVGGEPDADTDSDGKTVLVAEVPVAFGAFEFEDVAPGSYQIEVLCADRLIVVSPVAL